MSIQDKFNRANVIYKITRDIDLQGETLTIPEGCTLDFQGGSFSNGTIIGNNTAIRAGLSIIFNEINIDGSFNVDCCYVDWFYVEDSKVFNRISQTFRCIKFSNRNYTFNGNIVLGDNVSIIGGNANLILNHISGEPAPMFTVGNNNTITDLNIYCNEPSLEWNRIDLKTKENITIKRCTIDGFRHDSDVTNAWGIYLHNTKNVIIEECVFSNNSQADIAIVEGVENVVISKCSGNHLNIEPNSSNPPVNNITIESCKFKRMSILENSFTGVCSYGIKLNLNEVETLSLKGGNIYISNNNKIKTIVHPYYENVVFYMSELEYNDLHLGKELISSPHIYEILNENETELNGIWMAGYCSSGPSFTREVEDEKKYLRINPNNWAATARIYTNFKNLKEGEIFKLQITSRVGYRNGVVWASNFGTIRFAKNDGTTVPHPLVFHQNNSTENKFTTNWKTFSVYIRIPDGVNGLNITLLNCKEGQSLNNFLDVESISLKKVQTDININNKPLIDYVTKTPSSVYSASNSINLEGTIVNMLYSSNNDYEKLICTSSGNPGVWKGIGKIEQI